MRERAASRWETTTMAFRRWWTGGGGGGKVIGGGGEDGLVGTSLDFGIGFFQKEFQRIALSTCSLLRPKNNCISKV